MTEKILLGTYTKRESKGIYSITLDTKNETLTDLELRITEDNPTYLGVSNNNILYSVAKRDTLGGVAAYHLENDSSGLINEILVEGAPPCYIGIDNDRQLIFDANYHKGLVNVYRILENGGIELVETAIHSGSGPHPNQTSPHAHYADLTPDKRLISCDLGTDELYLYDVADSGKLSTVSVFHLTPGTGPRHITFHPNGQVAYVIGELNNTVTVLAYDQASGTFSHLQTLSMLPEDFKGSSAGGAIRLTKDGKNLYVSNRGHNSITTFSISANGEQATLQNIISSEGDFPRDFALNKTEEFLVVSHQESDNLTLFKRDTSTGSLNLLEKNIYAPECVCTYFI